MLLMSAGDESELEKWRTLYGRCQLPPEKMRPKPSMAEAIGKLPNILSLLVKTRLRAGGWLGPMCISADEVADITTLTKMVPREIMVLLLDVASAMGQMPGADQHIGAIAEGNSGAIYIGAPFAWSGRGVKMVCHGVQSAVLNAWHQGETRLRHLMVETPPCACCRQFMRELWNWNSIKILHASEGPRSIEDGSILDLEFSVKGLKTGNVKARMMGEAQRAITLNKSEGNELINLAADAASHSYAPYSTNFAGVALRMKRGTVHMGRYAECGESVAGVLAIESAILNVILSGERVTDIIEILLVEARGTVTQFSTTQKLTQAMGNIPFRFMMTT